MSGLGGDMVSVALLDLHVLSRPYGVPVAGWSNPWRYVWPRDSALVAAAFARTGHLGDAERISTFCNRSSRSPGCFRPATCRIAAGCLMVGASSSMASDGHCGRPHRWQPSSPSSDRTAFVQRHRMLIDRSTQAALNSIDNSSALPAPSADYWEVKEHRLTLATAAVALRRSGEQRESVPDSGR